MPDVSAPAPRRGRRPGPASSRAAILAAARARFARDGFDATTIRVVAGDAGVDASQVMQFFHSKEELFAAVMAVPSSALDRFDAAFDGPNDLLGERVTRAFFESWEGTREESEPLMATLRGAIVNEHAAAALRGFLQSRLLNGARGREEHAALRAGIAAAALVGVITSRNIIGVPSLTEADSEQIVSILAPAIQDILTGSSR
jgi:AcrR family transcriptional regulator